MHRLSTAFHRRHGHSGGTAWAACLVSFVISFGFMGCAAPEAGRESLIAIEKETEAKIDGGSLTNPPVSDRSFPLPGDGPWRLFNGRNLEGWEEADYVGKGEVTVEEGVLKLGRGYMTGVRWTNGVLRINYEVTYEAMRVDGTDFFCGFTFPVRDSLCSFIAGGWGGGVVGLSSINGMDAANNETTKYLNFDNGRWFKMRVRVTPEKIEAWIDEEQMVDQSIVDQELSIRIEMDACAPLGFATWSTTGAIRNIVLKKI